MYRFIKKKKSTYFVIKDYVIFVVFKNMSYICPLPLVVEVVGSCMFSAVTLTIFLTESDNISFHCTRILGSVNTENWNVKYLIRKFLLLYKAA